MPMEAQDVDNSHTSDTDGLVNLCSSSNGAHVLFATDEWFATAENLLNPFPPVFVPDLYCEQGKVMDGWETRRKRAAGHDWCVIQLGARGRDSAEKASLGGPGAFLLQSISVDTAYFTGNQAPRISLEAMKVERPRKESNEDENDQDYLYSWMPGAITRIARGGGLRGTGQSPSQVSKAAKACDLVALATTGGRKSQWELILPQTPLKPGYETTRYHEFLVPDASKKKLLEMGGVTHLKLNIFPDGGIARIKVWGHRLSGAAAGEPRSNSTFSNGDDLKAPLPRTHLHSRTSLTNPLPSSLPYPHPELSLENNGGRGLSCSNKHYGIPSNLIRSSLGKDMGDGWETARHPDRPPIVKKDPTTGLQDTPLMDWCILKLGLGGAGINTGISRIIVDTRHFKGNFPESVCIEGCYADPNSVSDEFVCDVTGAEKTEDVVHTHEKTPPIKERVAVLEWFPILERTALTADAEHEFLRDYGHLANVKRAVTHVRIKIYPDGGLSRIRVYGSPASGNVLSHL